MSDSPSGDPSAAARPEELPPVEPPSAGFIVQLFVVPFVIVAAVIGVWALFGRLASEDEDIQQVLADVESANPHRRGPAMLRLAQMLQVDARRESAEQQYVGNAAIAGRASSILQKWIDETPANHKAKLEMLNAQVFLARALGWLDVHDAVLPALQSAIRIHPEPVSGDQTVQTVRELEQEVRKSALASVSLIAGRAADHGQALESPSLVDDLIAVSGNTDEDPALRQLATFCLGLVPGEKSQEQLVALLKVADEKTNINAAMGLARQQSTAGFEVFAETLRTAPQPVDPDTTPGDSATERRSRAKAEEFERYVALKNTLKAVGDLADRFDASQRSELVRLVEPVARGHEMMETRLAAQEVLNALQK